MKSIVPPGFPGRVTFIKSAAKLSQAPHTTLPEVCFCGRSNVGKSSLLNTLCGRKQLARVSSTPGRTRLLNFFNVQDRLCVVDLPGYGWAKVPDAMQADWGKVVRTYLSDRPQLCLALILVDIRRGPAEEEYQLLDWFHTHEVPVVVIATKADKLAKNKRKTALTGIAASLGIHPRAVLPFSALKHEGREQVWTRILEVTDGP
jgi:GTP-binding protein